MTQATTPLQFYFAAWYFFDIIIVQTAFLCKAFYLDSTDVQIKILIVVDIVSLTTPRKYLYKDNSLI